MSKKIGIAAAAGGGEPAKTENVKSASMAQDRRRTAWIFCGLTVIFTVATRLFLFPTQYLSESFRNTYYIEKAIQDPEGWFGQHLLSFGHVMMSVLYYGVARVLYFMGYTGRLLFPLQIVSALFSLLAVLILYWLLVRAFGEPLPAFLLAGIFSIGYGFWFWSGQVKTYTASTFFLLLAVYLIFSRTSRWFVLGAALASALAISFFMGAVPIVPVVILCLFFRGERWSQSVKDAAIYLLATVVCITALYLVVFITVTGFIPRSINGLFGAVSDFRQVLSPGAIPGGISFLFPEGSVTFSGQLWLLLRCIVSQTLSPMNNVQGWPDYTIYDTATVALGLNNRLNLLFLCGMALVLLYWGIKTRFQTPSRGRWFLCALVWLACFSGTFFMMDAAHVFVYICALGLFFMLGAASSRPAWVILGLILAGLLWTNTQQVAAGHRPDDYLVKCRSLEGIVRRHDWFLCGTIGRGYCEPDWSIRYIFLARDIRIDEGDAVQLCQGRFPPSLTEKMKEAWRKGGKVFLNTTLLQACLPEESRSAFWRDLRAQCSVRPAFRFPDSNIYPNHPVEDYVELSAKAKR
ncbi:MAG: hypothetical protein V2A78_04405 [bacterium]